MSNNNDNILKKSHITITQGTTKSNNDNFSYGNYLKNNQGNNPNSTSNPNNQPTSSTNSTNKK